MLESESILFLLESGDGIGYETERVNGYGWYLGLGSEGRMKREEQLGTDSRRLGRRKQDHIRINLEEDVEIAGVTNGFEKYRLRHAALPELDLQDIDTSTRFLRKPLSLPLLISSMTGGTEEAYRINMRLATAAQAKGIAMGVGSQRILVEHGQAPDAWRALRQQAPDVPLLANLGLVQLNKGVGERHCRCAVDVLEADALVLHCNALQECVQAPQGDTNWKGLLARLEALCVVLPVPVIVKEVGWGIEGRMVQRLLDAGVAGIDVAGAGGTSWSEVEMHRAASPHRARVAAAFREWGLPTALCLESVAAVARAPTAARPRWLIASGGIRTGIEIVKSLALGADLVGLAAPFLRCAAQSTAAVADEIDYLQEVLSISMFCVGAATVADLRQAHILMAA